MPESSAEARCLPHGLYAVTPDGLPPDDLLARCGAALRGGAQVLQYRDKQRPYAQALVIAGALRDLCRRHAVPLIVNDNLELALAIDADGLHLGGDDGDLGHARRRLGPHRLLGASCYADLARAHRAVAAGADYVAFGAVYASPTKAHAARAPLTLFAHCRAELRVPSCAIGGITSANAAPVLAAGADLLAVISDLFQAPDVEARARELQNLCLGVSP